VPDVLDLTDRFGGEEPSSVDWAAVDDAVHEHSDAVSDIHATAEYRVVLAAELARRALAQAATNAGSLIQGGAA
jgi:aerobic carbon-monoxide dehydrogenase medium subunit